MTIQTRSGVNPRLVLGAAIILVGVMLTLDNLGLVDIGNPLRLWPVILIVIGSNRLLQARAGGDRGWGVGFLIAGVWLLLEELDLMPVGLFKLWPLALVVGGGALVWQALGGRRPLPAAGDADATMHAFALLSGVKRRSVSQAFRGGDLTAVLGACEIDLSRASTGPDEAVLDVFTLWGGVVVTVPATWVVISKAMPVLGALEDKTTPPAGAPAGRLVIRGFILMAGVEVRNP